MLGVVLLLSSAAVALSQQIGTVKDNYNLPFPIQRCTTNGCVQESTSATLDANWRWLHETSGTENCFVNNQWSSSVCSGSGAECASKCALEGITQSDWGETYGISQRAGGVRVNFKTKGSVGSRFYLLDDSQTYKLFSLKNREITFDVDVSTLPCGMNGAVYFSEMPAQGTGPAGAAYGTGYCDAQCPADVKFISGEANSEGWGMSGDGHTTGKYGSCCAEMDLWEANSQATAFTAHPCDVDSLYRCEGAECKTICDMPGCDYNSYRMGARKFYGPGPEFDINTLKPFTIVTQFITDDGTDVGQLDEVRRFYIQDGRKIENSKATLLGLNNQTSLSDDSCSKDKHVFGEEDTLAQFGGMKKMGEAIGRGMTLVLSLWDDSSSHMHWLDSRDPAGEDAEKPGVTRGPCSLEAGDPSFVRSHHSDAYVDYYNFKYGELGSTVTLGDVPDQVPVPVPVPAPQPPHVPVPAPVPVRVPAPQPPHFPVPVSERFPALQPPHFPPAPVPGKCCWGGCNGRCRGSGDWCAQSQAKCEGSCNGQWCAIGLSQVRQHRQLRGHDHVFLQKMRFTVGKQSWHKHERATEL